MRNQGLRIIYARMREDEEPPQVDLELHEYRVKGSRPNEPILAPGWWKGMLLMVSLFTLVVFFAFVRDWTGVSAWIKGQ